VSSNCFRAFFRPPLSCRSSRHYNDSLRGVRGPSVAPQTPQSFFSAGTPSREQRAKFIKRNSKLSQPTRKAMSDQISRIKQQLQKEIDVLSHELNVELPKEIAVARAHGDLSENAEYKSAKERQTYVNAKIAHLKKRMGDLGMLNLNNIPKDRSGYGSRILVL